MASSYPYWPERFLITRDPIFPSLSSNPSCTKLGCSPSARFPSVSLHPAFLHIRILQRRPETCASSVRRSFCPPLRIESGLRILRAHPTTAGMIGSGKRGEVKIFESVHEFSTNLADYVAELADCAVKERGAFAVALSGGSLISALGKLCEPPYLKTIDWSKWHVFWADERVVARNHSDSNYKLAKDGLLSKVPILPGQVYSISEGLSAEAAAEDYEFGLRQLVKTRIVGVSTSSDCPRFDLILLGMGPDGHVASLFPGHPLTHEKGKWIASITDSPKPPPQRITFTFPVINSAANVVMVLTGSNKAEVLEKAFGEELPPGVLPVQMVSPSEGKLVWFLDKAASSKLPGVDHLA